MAHSLLDSYSPCINPSDVVRLTSKVVQRCPLLETLALPHAEMLLLCLEKMQMQIRYNYAGFAGFTGLPSPPNYGR